MSFEEELGTELAIVVKEHVKAQLAPLIDSQKVQQKRIEHLEASNFDLQVGLKALRESDAATWRARPGIKTKASSGKYAQ